MPDDIERAIEAVEQYAQAISVLRATGVIRSGRFTGDLGEWYIECLYEAKRTASQTQKGWDILLPETGERLQVKTQSFDPANRWNYLGSDPASFDRLILVILNEDFTLRDLYDVPSPELRPCLRLGKEKLLIYYWDDLRPWRLQPKALPGYAKLARLIKG